MIPLTDEMRRTLQPLDRVRVRDDRGNEAEYEVKYAPWQLGHGDWVIGLAGIAGGYALERVTAIVSTRASRGPTPRELRVADRCEDDRDRFRAALELLAQLRHVSGSAQGAFRSNLAIVDAVLAGADVRDLVTVEAIAAGTWKPTH